MKRLFLVFSIASLAGQALACGGGFNDFVPCQAGQEAPSYNPFLAQGANDPYTPPISTIDHPLSQYELEQQRQQILQLQQMQLDQRRDAWQDSCPYGNFGCSTMQ